MENETQQQQEESNPNNTALINSFCEITSSSKAEALFFLESHQWDLDLAVSTFLDNSASHSIAAPSPIPTHSPSPDYSPSQSPSRSRSPSPAPSRAPYQLRSRRGAEKKKKKKKKKPSSGSGSSSRTTRGGIRTLADLNRAPSDGTDSDDDNDDDYDDDDDDDEPQEYYTGGEKSGMLVQDPTKVNDVDAIFNQAKHSAVERPSDYLQPSSSSRSFTGTARLLSGETVPSAPQQPEVVIRTITFWRNGFTIDDGPLRRMDDPANASFLESIKKSECPKELEPTDRRTPVNVNLVRREENYREPPEERQIAFQGMGRTLGSSTSAAPAASEPTVAATSLASAPLSSMGLVVDTSSPTTSIQLRLADGTRMVSRFNCHHTIREIRAFIDASRPGGQRNYQLQIMGFPPKQLTDLDQTIEQAGIANSVVIQKF